MIQVIASSQHYRPSMNRLQSRLDVQDVLLMRLHTAITQVSIRYEGTVGRCSFVPRAEFTYTQGPAATAVGTVAG